MPYLAAPVVLGCHVASRHVLADVAERRRRLEVVVRDLRQFRRRLGEGGDVAVAQAVVGGLVHDHVRLGGEFSDRHAPFLCSGVEQDAARLGASYAHRLEVAAGGEARRGVEVVRPAGVAVLGVVPARRR